MPNSPSPSAFSASTRPLAPWTPGTASPLGSASSGRRQNIYNFNNLDDQTASRIKRLNLGRDIRRSAGNATKT
ncbi:hypothetical protein ACFXHA_21820 [Nocardia sp. NPDC059240]|uniref:hypothetical protein n=1 Tax=Nocardia sp. NPDC059240 TaxID=3346786 RepID=UPI0036ABA427